MPFLLTNTSLLTCAHGGKVVPTSTDARVRIMGTPVVPVTFPWMVAGCPAGATPPAVSCVSVKFVTGTTRVRASGVPLVTDASVGLAVPTSTPAIVVSTQRRVTAQ